MGTTKNLSRSAERLAISQPSLSLAIKRLEKTIGVTLLIRHPLGVKLTESGQQLFLHAKQLVKNWREIKSATISSRSNVQGKIILGCHLSLAESFLLNFMPILLKNYPKLDLTILNDVSRNIVEQTDQFEIDIGIVSNPIKRPNLIMQKLLEDQMGFYQVSNVRNKNVNDSRILICDPTLKHTADLLKKCLINFKRVIHLSNLKLIAELAVKSDSIAIIPQSIANEFEILKPVKTLPFLSEEIFLIYREENKTSTALQAVIQAIKQTLV